MFVVLGLFSLTYPPLISPFLSLLSNPPPHVLLHWGLAFSAEERRRGRVSEQAADEMRAERHWGMESEVSGGKAKLLLFVRERKRAKMDAR